MQVQPIQSTNNYCKPNFKAHFVNDAQGNFRLLWEIAQKDSALMQKIDKFASKHRNHALEIISTRDGYSWVGSGADKTRVCGDFYEVFNHYTGKISEYFSCWAPNAKLSGLIDSIENDKQLFQADELAKSYRLLTGQEKMPVITV